MSCIAVLFSLRSHSSAALDAAEVALITLRCFGHSLTFSFRDCFRMVSLPQVAITNLLISNIVVLTTEYDCSNAKALPASGQQLLEGWLFSWWFCSRHCETWCYLALKIVLIARDLLHASCAVFLARIWLRTSGDTGTGNAFHAGNENVFPSANILGRLQ